MTYILAIVALLLLQSCSDGSSSDTLPASSNEIQTRIEGEVFDALSGEPIRDAIIRTDPPTEEVATTADGSFVLNDSFNGGGTYQVLVDHFAYETAQANVSVATNTTTRVDFALQSSAIGLHASTSSLRFAVNSSRESLRLSSNIQNTGYSILVSDPWVTVTPSQGVIANRESVFIDVLLDRVLLPPDSTTSSEIVINADNGTRELVITLLFDTSTAVAGTGSAGAATAGTDTNTDTQTNSRQLDCRQPEALRIGLNDVSAPLVQFADSVELPANAGTRYVDTTNPFLVDSFVLHELGTVTLTHVAGGPDDTSIQLFEFDLDESLVTLGVNDGASTLNRRARLEWGLVPGVYCYYLGGTSANFVGPVSLQIDFDFTPPQ